MGQKFDQCRERGGKIRTEKISTGRYRRICIEGEKVYKGHIETKKGHERKKKK